MITVSDSKSKQLYIPGHFDKRSNPGVFVDLISNESANYPRYLRVL